MQPRYQFIELVGEGAFGRVWKALDHDTGHYVAVKELVRSDPSDLVRFEREIRILKSLRGDPHVVHLVDYDLEAEVPQLVLEFCSGGSLRAHVGRPQDWRTVALAVACAARGLQRIHGAGGFHRDIKPDNLLLTTLPDGRWIVKVADFGIARTPVTRRPPMTHGGGGTEGYIAPEVLRGAAFAASADVYSLGVVASELLGGQLKPQALGMSAVPAPLRALIASMLDGNPSRRPAVTRVARVLQTLLQPAQPAVAKADAKPAGSGFGGLLFAAGLLALAAILGSDDEA